MGDTMSDFTRWVGGTDIVILGSFEFSRLITHSETQSLSPVGQSVLLILLESGVESDSTEHFRKTAKSHVLRAVRQKYVYFGSISIGALGNFLISQK
jgi:hypothetical protein